MIDPEKARPLITLFCVPRPLLSGTCAEGPVSVHNWWHLMDLLSDEAEM